MAQDSKNNKNVELSEDQKESLRTDGMNGVNFKTACKNAKVVNDTTSKKYWDDGVEKGRIQREQEETD